MKMSYLKFLLKFEIIRLEGKNTNTIKFECPEEKIQDIFFI